MQASRFDFLYAWNLRNRDLSFGRGSGAPAICPDSEIILRPIFNDNHRKTDGNILFPSTNPQELANAIVEVVDAGANIINLSLGLSTSPISKFSELQEAYDYAFKKRVIIVAGWKSGKYRIFPCYRSSLDYSCGLV